MRENIEKERERLNMEQTALNSQINSHFLYNTLNTVKWMAVRAGNEEIARMVVALVNMLEYSCKKIDVPVLISEEINFIKNYVCIQEGRCCSSVHMKFDIDPKLENCLILKMLLQPVVENAMQHGFGEDNIDNRILITGRLLGDRVQFQIRAIRFSLQNLLAVAKSSGERRVDSVLSLACLLYTSGDNIGMGKDHTLFALVDGTVNFKVGKEDRRYVSVIPATDRKSVV